MLGLPDGVRACLFDLDGVLTDTASVHAAAWKEMFDAFLAERDEPPFDIDRDYGEYVDGKPRADGVRSFLGSRGIELPSGAPDDPPTEDTVCGLGNRKNDLVLAKIHHDGVTPYPGSVRFLRAATEAGLKRAVVSSSANCHDVLVAADIERYLQARIDGVVAAERHLAGKPAPDTYLAAATELGVEPGEAAVFEDALAGVRSGRAGDFGYVVGVNRVGHADALRDAGADVVVDDLADLLSDLPGES